jgi:hypothetical protein
VNVMRGRSSPCSRFDPYHVELIEIPLAPVDL